MKDEVAPPGIRRVRIRRAPGGEEAEDWLVVEEPLEVEVDGAPLTLTMRTPGHDRELVAGLLYSEGIVRHRDDLLALEGSRDPLDYDPDNLVTVRLAPAAAARRGEVEQARREVVTTSACGLCGRKHLDDVVARLPRVAPLEMPFALLAELPGRLGAHQKLFRQTGGLHAAALFDGAGALLGLYEDIGRHNALDKLVGASLLAGELPWQGRVVVTTARAGFELVQKTLMAGAGILIAVGATSSLAVEVARRGGLALYAFARNGRANFYG
jgi:FdhD protein